MEQAVESTGIPHMEPSEPVERLFPIPPASTPKRM